MSQAQEGPLRRFSCQSCYPLQFRRDRIGDRCLRGLSLQQLRAPGAPLPSTGSLGSVPPLPRYYWSTPTPHCPSRFASLPSLSRTAAASLDSLPREVGHLTPVSLDLLLPVALPALCRGDNGVSQVPGRTLARLPSLLRPRGDLGAWPATTLRCSLRLLDGVRLS